MNAYHVIGLMSGSSMDGVDLAYIVFQNDNDIWNYEIQHVKTINYPDFWITRLNDAADTDAFEYNLIHNEYGDWLGEQVRDFVQFHKLNPNLVASHGHTVFHQPDKGVTVQIGHGANLARQSGIPVVCDFRSLDVAYGGQGAPLVPFGDKLLFPNYEYCLNLGGFANISYDSYGKRIAFDICPVNTVLNQLSEKLGRSFDDKGLMAAKGNLNRDLLSDLGSIPYYQIDPPKSLGKEWVEQFIFPVLDQYAISTEDKLRTYIEHISYQIIKATKSQAPQKLFITGGGAYNDFLIQRIENRCMHQVIIPHKTIIEYKEALIFAFLGVLRFLGKENVLGSVTGAPKDLISGAVYLP